jgi:hypothetical protein
VKKAVVIRVTETEFELEDGRVYPHLVVLDNVPTVEEFQSIYDHWFAVFNQEFAGKVDARPLTNDR